MNASSLPKYDVHVCLVSKQTTPNLLPVLESKSRPELVLLLTTPVMRKNAEILARVMRGKGCQTAIVDLPAEGSVLRLREALLDIFAQYEDRHVACNVTGGTKLMALAALEVCRGLDRPAFYVNTNEKTVVCLSPELSEVDLPDLLSVKDILTVQGYEVLESRQPVAPEVSRRLTEQLVSQASRFKGALGLLNKFAMDAHHSPTLTARLPELSKNAAALFKLFEDAGRLRIQGDVLSFPDEESRCYANGGWLEEYAASVLFRLQARKKVRDCLANIRIRSTDGVENELDLAFTAQNRLFVLECKTANIAAENGKAEAAAYKLEALRELVGGVMTQPMLLSFTSMREADKKRCESYGIRYVEAERLATLETILHHWITP